MNIKNRHITKLALILIITAFVTGLSSCDGAQQIIEPGILQADTSTPLAERDHVWAVDQNGVGACPGDLGACVTHALKFDLYDQ